MNNKTTIAEKNRRKWSPCTILFSLFVLHCSLFTFSSCTRVDLEDPLKGKITLTTDWSKRTPGITQPASYTVTINNQTLTFNTNSNLLPELSAGTYPIHVYNTADKITLSGTTATVASNNNQLDPLPGWLFTATTQAVYTDFKVETITAVMQQQVRQLTLVLTPTGGSKDKITNITAQLSGVAGAWNFATNQPAGSAMNAPLTFAKQADGSWQATVRLLGVAGTQQKLTGTISFAGGSPADMTLDSNLSTSLANFITNKEVPLSLGGTMQETPTEAGFGATINGWTPVTSGGIAQ